MSVKGSYGKSLQESSKLWFQSLRSMQSRPYLTILNQLILAFLRNVQGSLGLDVYETSAEEEMAAALLMDKVKLDFDDTAQYYLAKKLGVEAIVSYDKHFDAVDVSYPRL